MLCLSIESSIFQLIHATVHPAVTWVCTEAVYLALSSLVYSQAKYIIGGMYNVVASFKSWLTFKYTS